MIATSIAANIFASLSRAAELRCNRMTGMLHRLFAVGIAAAFSPGYPRNL